MDNVYKETKIFIEYEYEYLINIYIYYFNIGARLLRD